MITSILDCPAVTCDHCRVTIYLVPTQGEAEQVARFALLSDRPGHFCDDCARTLPTVEVSQ